MDGDYPYSEKHSFVSDKMKVSDKSITLENLNSTA